METNLASGSSNAEHLDGALTMARGLALALGDQRGAGGAGRWVC